MSALYPRALLAGAPGWWLTADVCVVGSGVAGLTTAIRVRRSGKRVLLVTKALVDEGSTRWAQGGIAAALAEDDSPAAHEIDTLVAGAGLCDLAAVKFLVTQGPAAVRRLIAIGAQFDLEPSGAIALGREGGHHHDRIAHAGGDATGAEISRALVAAVARDEGIETIENALVLDLLQDSTGAVQGLTLHVMGQGQRDGVGGVLAPAVVLATGGIGQVFSATTNPGVATGDGVAMGLRAGAAVADLEFVQFHPTVLWLGPDARGQQPLVSEAVRGEGAVLRDDDGVAFMAGQHPQADLAPRDVVAKAIMRRMRQTGAEHVWLDARDLGRSVWEHRFPTILESCRRHGVDPITELIPVAPAQHYASGGLRTDSFGRATIPGLYACGECACTGVHGANRLASNSLLEGLVFAERIGDVIAGVDVVRRDPIEGGTPGLLDGIGRRQLQRAMTEGVGVLRSAESMVAATKVITAMKPGDAPATASWETTNLALLAGVLATHALLREETRGSHWREDFADRDDEHWLVRLVSNLSPDGEVVTRREPLTAPESWKYPHEPVA